VPIGSGGALAGGRMTLAVEPERPGFGDEIGPLHATSASKAARRMRER
jgi:hypothetical protein